MKKRGIFLVVVFAFLVFGLIVSSGETAKSAGGQKAKADEGQARYVPERILVKFKDDPRGMIAESGRIQAEYSHNLKRLRHFKRIDVNVYEIKGSVEETLKALQKDPNVAYAEPDYIQSIDVTIPNDASFGSLWGMNNTGQTGGTADADIDAPEAWDLTRGSSSVVVAVIDTGVAYTHPDLAANMWINPGEVASNGIDDDSNGYIDDVHGINAITGSGDPMDDNNHGTHCSGTIAGVGDNSIGVAGVCWTARIMALKFLDAAGSGDTSNAITCIEYAIAEGAHILSNSWGGGGYSQALKDAIDDAGTAGLLFCAAAGNFLRSNEGNPFYPSSYLSPNIIAVAATDHNDILSVWGVGSGSHWGALSVDVAAPGTGIYSTITGNSYASFNGTSMATPHVAGLAALLKSYNFSLNWMQLRDRILGGADPKAALSGLMQTGARINAYNSLVMADVTSYDLNIQSSPPPGVSITVSPADLDGYSSGSTNFTRRYTPYETVTLTAPETFGSYDFGYWTIEGVYYSAEPSISFPVDYIHTVVANYLLPLHDAIDNASLSMVTFYGQGGWIGQTSTYYSGGDAAQSPDIPDNQYVTLQTSVIGPGNLSFYWKVSSEPNNDLLTWYIDGDAQYSISGEADWQQVNLPVSEGLHIIRWIYSKDDSGSSGSDCGWVDDVQFTGSPATLGLALDQQSLSCSTSEYAGWFPEPWTYQYDTDAVQSGYIADNEGTSFMTSVEGPTPLSFYWKVSSEGGYDFLRFYIDGALRASISGNVDWHQMSYSLESGPHVLTWTYSKDVSFSSLSDCGWVDHIEVNPAGTYALSLAKAGTGNGKVKVGDDPLPHDLPYEESFTAGASVGIEAVPDLTSTFSSWSGDLVSTSNPTTVILDSDKNVTANFESSLAPGITVTSPNGGESWPMLSTHPVTWTQTSLTGTVTIDLHKGGSFRKTLGTADATAGTFSWFISPSEPIGTDYRIVIWQGSVTDSSDADFGLEAASPIVLQESFSGSTVPAGWTHQNVGTTIPWYLSLSSNAGGAPNEMRRSFSGGTLTRLVAPPIDTTGRTNMTLSFRHFFDTWATGGIVLKVQTSPDGTNWTDEAWTVTSGSTDIGPETVNTTLTHNFGIATTYVGFVLAGDLVYMDYWYIDDVEVSGEVVPPVNCRIDFNGDGQEDILWRNHGVGAYQGLNVVWLMNQTGSSSSASILSGAGPTRSPLKSEVMNIASRIASRSLPEAGLMRNKFATPQRGFKSILGGGSTPVPRISMAMKDPLEAGQRPLLKTRSRLKGEPLKGILTRQDAVDPQALSKGDIKAVALQLGTEVVFSQVLDTAWEIAGTGDFNGDDKTDILWRYYGTGPYQGLCDVWFMDGTTFVSESVFSAVPDTNWRIAGTGDFNGDGETDILWRYQGTGTYQGLNVVWFMSDVTFIGEVVFSQVLDTDWRIAGTGDFNGDGETDILWRNYGTGAYQGLNDIWFMNDTTFVSESVFSAVTDTAWEIAGTGDFNGDGHTDILWRYYGTGAYQGLNDIWYMDGTTFVSEEVFSQVVDTNWRIVNR